jgi:hypothetical protein
MERPHGVKPLIRPQAPRALPRIGVFAPFDDEWLAARPALDSPAAQLRPPDRYLKRLVALDRTAPPSPRSLRTRSPTGSRAVPLELLWLMAQFGAVMQSSLGWLIGTFAPAEISKFTSGAKRSGLVDVLLVHPRRTDRSTGGGGQAFLVLTHAGRGYLEARLGAETRGALPRFLDVASLLQSPRAGKQFSHDQRVIAWTLAYLWRARGSVWSLRSAWAPDTSLRQPLRPGRQLEKREALQVDELTRQRFRTDLQWRGITDTPSQERLRPDATIHRNPTGFGALTDTHIEFQSGAWKELDRKLPKYDRYLAGWCYGMTRYEETGRRPVVIFACAPGQLEPIMAKAHASLRAQVTITGARLGDVYYPARDHVLFCDETAIHRGDVRAWRLPAHPGMALSAEARPTLLFRAVA